MKNKICTSLIIIFSVWIILFILQDAKLFTLFNVQGIPISTITIFLSCTVVLSAYQQKKK